YAEFVRSPHAHARIVRIDASAALAAPGVIGVLTGAELKEDKVGGLIGGWMIHSKDGSPVQAAPHAPPAADVLRYAGNPVRGGAAETKIEAGDGAELMAVEYAELPGVVDPAATQAPGAPQIHAEAPGNTIYQWSLGDKDAVDRAFAGAAQRVDIDLINNRLVPN